MQPQARSESTMTLAIEALKAALHHASGVKVRKIDTTERPDAIREIEILAQIEIYGRSHTLACMLLPDDIPEQLRESVVGFCHRAVEVAGDTTPVLITPRLSTGFQALCRETRAGMIDLQGNARLELGELFIACQQAPHPAMHRKTPRLHVAHDSVHRGAAA
jgi:hypothetical protein